MHEFRQHDEVTDVELASLKTRLGNAEPTAHTVAAFAEATGMSEADVLAALHQIRAEAAFRPAPPPQKNRNLLYVAGAVVLATVVGGVAWVFAIANAAEQAVVVRPTRPPVMSQPRPPKQREAPITVVSFGPEAPPRGMQVDVCGVYAHVVGQNVNDSSPLTLAEFRAQFAACLKALAEKVETGDVQAPDGAPLVTRTMTGRQIQQHAGYVAVDVTGDYGVLTTHLPVAYEPSKKAAVVADRERRIKLTVDQMTQSLADSLSRQLSAAPAQDPRQMVSPPPGYSLEFVGRRTATVNGGKLLFKVDDQSRVVECLVVAVKDAVAKDAGPDVRRPRESAEADSSVPVPAESTVVIKGPRGALEFRVPTSPGGQFKTAVEVADAADKIIRAKAREAVLGQ